MLKSIQRQKHRRITNSKIVKLNKKGLRPKKDKIIIKILLRGSKQYKMTLLQCQLSRPTARSRKKPKRLVKKNNMK